jgi:uncharacterized protein
VSTEDQASGTEADVPRKARDEKPVPPADAEWVHFRPSSIHGLGGFAKRDIPAGTRLLEYVGERIDKQESLRRCERNNVYLFALNAREDLDGNVDWNPARFLNHSCASNCEARLEQGRIWLVACRDIRADEELTFNYGFDLEDYRDYPCHCGSPDCVGYIVSEVFFERLRGQPAQSRTSRSE